MEGSCSPEKRPKAKEAKKITDFFPSSPKTSENKKEPATELSDVQIPVKTNVQKKILEQNTIETKSFETEHHSEIKNHEEAADSVINACTPSVTAKQGRHRKGRRKKKQDLSNEKKVENNMEKTATSSTTDTEPVPIIYKKSHSKTLSRKKDKSLDGHKLTDSRKKNESLDSHKLTEYFPVRRSDRRPKCDIEKQKRMDLEKAILNRKEEGMKVVDLPGKGRGVIAKKSFKRGEFVVEYAGDLIDIAEAKDRELDYGKDTSIGCYMYYFNFKNKKYCVDATKESGRLGRLINHSSKSGNCQTRVVGIGERPYLTLEAARDIKKGEELLYDYGDRNKETLQSHPWLAT